MSLFVVFEDDGFDGGIALDQDTCGGLVGSVDRVVWLTSNGAGHDGDGGLKTELPAYQNVTMARREMGVSLVVVWALDEEWMGCVWPCVRAENEREKKCQAYDQIRHQGRNKAFYSNVTVIITATLRFSIGTPLDILPDSLLAIPI